MPAPIRLLFDLTGRAAIVTGGGTHLGTAFATTLAELGAAVYIASRRGELCEEVAARLRGSGLDVTGLGCDATDESQVDGLVGRVMADRGRLDVMVCNAGGSLTTTYLPEASIDEFRSTLDMNVTSTYICAQSAARAMIPRRSGSIITLGSIHAFLASDKRMYANDFKRSGPPYQAAKGAVLNLTRALAAELGEHQITVNCISPGQIPNPEGGPESDADTQERFRQANALQRTGIADDVKGAVALLASDGGRWITGQNIIVDGGWSIW